MQANKLLLLVIICLALSACGKKGPVKPIDTTLNATEQTAVTK